MSWGRVNRTQRNALSLNDRRTLPTHLQQRGIAFGMGRSYGDVCLNPNGQVWLTRGLDHFIAFDPISGRLRCEAGVLLRDIQQLFMPRGWMLPVVPGTQSITVGGAIANDVHGKNHHGFGSFGHHVTELLLHRTDGQQLRCSLNENRDWFCATLGGIGLTGVIVEVELQLRNVDSLWLDTETIAYRGWDEFISLSQHKSAQWEHTVSWFDCRRPTQFNGVFLSASPRPSSEPLPPRSSKTMPIEPPLSLMNRASMALLNNSYYWSKKWQSKNAVHDYESFLFPLDAIHQWNRIYGPRGFYQYQCVIPFASARDAINDMLHSIAQQRQGSFLAVLKTFGDRPSLGLLSFPQPGVTLALDFPNRGEQTEKLFTRLDQIVQRANGKIYLAKDGRMPRALFEATYANIAEFNRYRDPGISSAMSQRLMGS